MYFSFSFVAKKKRKKSTKRKRKYATVFYALRAWSKWILQAEPALLHSLSQLAAARSWCE